MLGNPFTYGNPISDPQRFIGREREVEQIFGRLRNAEFESSSLVGDHRIGKTSLLKYLANPEVREAHGFKSGRYCFVYVDLQVVPQSMDPDRLWRRLLILMRQQCADRGVREIVADVLKRDELDPFELGDLFQQVDDNGQHVVFLFDEFERVTANPNFGPDFFFGMRSLAIQHKVALVTSSRRELVDVCSSPEVRSSPFFNIFANIRLRMFSQAEYELLVERALAQTEVVFTEPELDSVVALAGLHPYFLQVACHKLFDAYERGLDPTARHDFLVDGFKADAVPHISDYWDKSGDFEKITLTASAMLERTAAAGQGISLPAWFTLGELQRVFSRVEPWVELLSNRGLLMTNGDRYRLFSSVAGPWILTQIAAELNEEQTYHEWLTRHQAAVDRVSGKHGGMLRELLPKIGPRYRNLIITWASDPQAVVAMTTLLKSVLSLVR
jgi:hypothetical protein